ncbi:hypothetical protein RDV89_17420 [Nocardioides zeae]|uniref:Uncharacterized protein n=1 Tax=Nocardioides imazamoxiresistens TaxID=3231893 RepID=A0ABU3Q039_9ACTN|nr:hypothetical protein [Nocardioides zeae]MDT9594872.1 hypothetical protein [Nocardioides zeae]
MGIAGAVAGIGATIYFSRPSKPKVQVEVANAFAAYDTRLGDWCVSVEAINRGGSAVTIAGFGFEFPNQGNLVPIRTEPGSTPLPHRLEPHASATFLMQAEGILAECAQRGVHPSRMRSWVRLQTGRTVYGAGPPIEPD